MRVIRVSLPAALAVLGFALAFATTPAHAAKAVDGTCGYHIGKLVRRDQIGSQYRFRIGPKYHKATSPMRCHGVVASRRRGRSAASAGSGTTPRAGIAGQSF
jgi:hypothetical protein